MSDNPTILALGSPRFSDERLAALHRAGDTAACWRDLGPEGIERVAGNFAVGVREPGGRSWLAVDRFGIESICWRIVDGQLRVAARADELADGDAQIDPQAIFDYLYFHAIPSPRTIFKDVFRLPPGHFGVFEHGQMKVAPYFVPAFQEPGNPSFDSLAVEFRQLLREAVETQLDGSKPACFLSGGTDSSTVAGMIGEVSGQRASSYSIGFDAQGYDEMEFARVAAKQFETDHHEYYVTPSDLVQSIGAVASHFDQPFGNSSALPAYYCAKMARDDGVTRLLAGDGGDELFGGNTRYAKQRVFGWWDQVPRALRTGLVEPMLERQGNSAVPLLRKAASYVEQAKVPMPDRLQMYNLILRLQPAKVLTPALLARIDQSAPLAQQRLVWAMAGDTSSVNRQLAFDWRFTLAESDLPKVMGATSLAGVGVGFPFLDDRLLEFSCRLPSNYKLKGLKLRWFFKEALRGFLPDQIIAKKKQGFGLPFGLWANQNAELNALARESLQAIAARGVVRGDFVDELLEHRLAEHPGYYGEMVWILMMLEQWLRIKAPNFRIED
ncbi:MAG: asparagine synthase C-terminal domain-containing protein [Burkholderiales bacterium]